MFTAAPGSASWAANRNMWRAGSKSGTGSSNTTLIMLVSRNAVPAGPKRRSDAGASMTYQSDASSRLKVSPPTRCPATGCPIDDAKRKLSLRPSSPSKRPYSNTSGGVVDRSPGSGKLPSPIRMSSPSPPRSSSLPSPPTRKSLPEPPSMKSSSAPPQRRSLPSPPRISSAPISACCSKSPGSMPHSLSLPGKRYSGSPWNSSSPARRSMTVLSILLVW